MARENQERIRESISTLGAAEPILRKSDCKHPMTDYMPGTIFSAAIHISLNYNNAVAGDDPNVTVTPCGAVQSKFRRFIVVKQRGPGHLEATPIFTFGGHGLDFKRYHENYICIRDGGLPKAEHAPNEVPRYPVLLADRDKNLPPMRTFIAGRSVVSLAEPENFKPAFLLSTIEGKLQGQSLDNFLAAVKHVEDSQAAILQASSGTKTKEQEKPCFELDKDTNEFVLVFKKSCKVQ
jgi:hypothetical protein